MPGAGGCGGRRQRAGAGAHTDYTETFDAFEARTEGLGAEQRIAEFRSTFDRSKPGFYTDKDPARLDR